MTTVILAGGRGRRFGREKATLPFEGSTLLQTLVCRFVGIGKVIVVARSDQELAVEGAQIVHDKFPESGPLGGLHAGLMEAKDDAVFLLGCDMPLALPEIAVALALRIRDHLAVVPNICDRLQPLQAIYSKKALPIIDGNLREGRLKMLENVQALNALVVPGEELRKIDPDLLSFTNINTTADYEDALRIIP